MSRRFGRSQRRALREVQAQIEGFHIREQQWRVRAYRAEDRLDQLLQRLEEWDSDIRSMLGPYTSLAFNDTTFRVRSLNDIRQLPVVPRLDISHLLLDRPMESLEYYVERILTLTAGLSGADATGLSRHMRLQIHCDNHPIGLAVSGMSESYWLHVKSNPESHRRVVRQIAEDLLRELVRPPRKPSGEPHAQEQAEAGS